MNDKFLTELQETPSRAFDDALHARLVQQDFTDRHAGAPKILAIVLAAVALPFAIAFAFSPQVRAGTQQVIQTIGDLTFDLTGDYPFDNLGRPVEVDTAEMSLDEARAVAPFPIRVPTWAPPGYQLEQRVSVTRHPGENNIVVNLFWLGDENRIILSLFPAESYLSAEGIMVGPDSVEEVLINGQPGAIVRGAWNPDTRSWRPDMLISLLWKGEGRSYAMAGIEGRVSATDLVRMAESMR